MRSLRECKINYFANMTYILLRTIAIIVTSIVTGVGVAVTKDIDMVITALLVALVLAVLNHTIKPILSIVLSPITLITLGLFSFVINGAMIVLAQKIVPSFQVPSFLMAVWFAFVLAIVNGVLHIFDGRD